MTSISGAGEGSAVNTWLAGLIAKGQQAAAEKAAAMTAAEAANPGSTVVKLSEQGQATRLANEWYTQAHSALVEKFRILKAPWEYSGISTDTSQPLDVRFGNASAAEKEAYVQRQLIDFDYDMATSQLERAYSVLTNSGGADDGYSEEDIARMRGDTEKVARYSVTEWAVPTPVSAQPPQPPPKSTGYTTPSKEPAVQQYAPPAAGPTSTAEKPARDSVTEWAAPTLARGQTTHHHSHHSHHSQNTTNATPAKEPEPAPAPVTQAHSTEPVAPELSQLERLRRSMGVNTGTASDPAVQQYALPAAGPTSTTEQLTAAQQRIDALQSQYTVVLQMWKDAADRGEAWAIPKPPKPTPVKEEAPIAWQPSAADKAAVNDWYKRNIDALSDKYDIESRQWGHAVSRTNTDNTKEMYARFATATAAQKEALIQARLADIDFSDAINALTWKRDALINNIPEDSNQLKAVVARMRENEEFTYRREVEAYSGPMPDSSVIAGTSMDETERLRALTWQSVNTPGGQRDLLLADLNRMRKAMGISSGAPNDPALQQYVDPAHSEYSHAMLVAAQQRCDALQTEYAALLARWQEANNPGKAI